jgi:ubiquinone/menaquinone biosynthesis C-methylase UbiE
MEQLVALMPEKRGNILDVACGKGATTQHLLRYFQPANVVAINISEKQLQTARANAPGCLLLAMDAVNLAFADESFENIICVEAAFHFNTRESFIHEAYRVLKPGGYLLLSDMIYARIVGEKVKDLGEYTSAYRRAGFQDTRVIDGTKECWRDFRRNLLRYIYRKAIKREGILQDAVGALSWLVIQSIILKRYLLVSAQKA